MSSAEDATRKKRASLVLALLLLATAVILTIIYLDPGTREPESRAPAQAPPRAIPSPTPSPISSSASSASGGSSGAGQSGGGSGAAQCVVGSSGLLACPNNFTITGNTAGLYPGKTVQLPLTITNPNEQDIRVTSLTVSVVGTSSSSCSASFLETANYYGTGFIVPANGSSTITLPVSMTRSAPDACQSVTFALSYAGKAEEA